MEDATRITELETRAELVDMQISNLLEIIKSLHEVAVSMSNRTDQLISIMEKVSTLVPQIAISLEELDADEKFD